MLHVKIKHFIHYCQVSNFSKRSIETLSARLNEFNQFISSESISALSDISYKYLQEFVADYKAPSVHAKKSRVWALHQFFHFLKLNHWIDDNIALGIPYPKMQKTVPQYLTPDEYNQLLSYFYQRANSAFGLRNLCLIMCFGFLGFRLQTIISLDIEDIDLEAELAAIKEKGGKKRTIVLPKALSAILEPYLVNLGEESGPLFLSKNKRIHERTLQDIFRSAADHLGIEKHLHAHLFRHTAATHLNKVAGVDITQFVLGHTRRSNTVKYTHLNPDEYANYMRKHPFMKL